MAKATKKQIYETKDGYMPMFAECLATHPNDPNMFHNENGPTCRLYAVTKDGTPIKDDFLDLYHIRGIEVDKRIVLNPETITVEEIDREANQEIKAVLLERMGITKYISNSKNLEILHTDKDEHGLERMLIRKELAGYEDPVMGVLVTNTTPEPDGSHNKYFLWCVEGLKPIHDPGIDELNDSEEVKRKKKERAMELTLKEKSQELTCHNAVASTFGLRGEQYGLKGQKRQGDVLVTMYTGKSAGDDFAQS